MNLEKDFFVAAANRWRRMEILVRRVIRSVATTGAVNVRVA